MQKWVLFRYRTKTINMLPAEFFKDFRKGKDVEVFHEFAAENKEAADDYKKEFLRKYYKLYLNKEQQEQIIGQGRMEL